MWFYKLQILWILPLCWPLGVATVGAFISRSWLVLVVPIVLAVFCMHLFPLPPVYAEYAPDAVMWQIHLEHIKEKSAHRREVALWAGLLSTLVMMIAVQLWKSFNRRPSEGPQPFVRPGGTIRE